MNPMKRTRSTCTRFTWLSGLTLLLASVASLHAQVDIQYVTTFNSSGLVPFPTYNTVTGTISGSGSTEITAAAGVPTRARTRYGVTLDANNQMEWTIQPTLKDGVTYQIDIAHNSTNTSATSCSTDVLITAFTTDGALSPSVTNTPYFQRQYGGTNWWKIGYITNYPGTTQPTIHFAYSGGTVAGGSGQTSRLYIDAFRFTEISPCTGVAVQPGISGPLAANQTTVSVTGIDAASTNISLFADGVFIGQKTSGIVAGSNSVTVNALAQGQEIKATQSKNGCTSTLPANGPIVGGGANPSVNAFLSCWSNNVYAGPVGTNSSSPATGLYYVLKGTGATGSQGAPLGGQQLQPGPCWQTVTFDHAADSQVVLASAATMKNADQWAALDALVFAIDTSGTADSGPYDIYVDQIMNGDTVIEDFESYTLGSTSRLNNPNAQGQFPNPAVAYLSSPNSSTVSTNYAYSGTKSCRIRWQWQNTQSARWARIQFNATAGKNYPQVDTTKPITVRYLVLPVGQSTEEFHFATSPTNQNLTPGQTAIFRAAPSGAGTFAYQWVKNSNILLSNGGNVSGATTTALTLANVAVADTGAYNLTATEIGGQNCSATIGALLNVVTSVPPSSLSYSYSAPNLTLSWSAGVLQTNGTILSTGNAWGDVPGATSPYPVTPSKTQQYYRLRGQ